MTDPPTPELDRQLRLQIARKRRQIDARLHELARDARRLAALRTYLRHFPIRSLLSALGLGLAATSRVRPLRAVRRGGLAVAGWLARRTARRLWRRATALWNRRKKNAGDTQKGTGGNGGNRE